MKKNILIIAAMVLLSASCVFAGEAVPITEKQIAEITQTLRNVLDENRKLAEGNEETSARLKALEQQFQDSQKKSSGNSEDIEAIKKEQSRLSEENDRLKNIIQDFKSQLDGALDQQKQKSKPPVQDYSGMNVSEKADLVAEKSTEIKENTADVYYQMAEEAFADGEYQKAVESYQKCLSLNPDSRFVNQINRQIAAAQKMLAH